MRWILLCIELLLIFLAAALYTEIRWHVVERIIDDYLHRNHISMHISWPDLTRIELSDIRYHQKPLAKGARIDFALLPLFQKQILIKHLLITDLDGNTLTSIKLPHASSKKPTKLPVTLLIKRVDATAHYRHTGRYDAKLTATNVTLQKATIRSLTLRTPYGKIHAHGSYAKQALQLRLRAIPANLPVQLRTTPITGSVHIDAKALRFDLSAKKATLQTLAISQLHAKGTYDYVKLAADIDATLAAYKSQATLQGKLLYDTTLHYQAHGTLTNAPYTQALRYDAYKSFAYEIQGNLHTLQATLANDTLRASAHLQDFKSFRLHIAPLQAARLIAQAPKDMRLSLDAEGTLNTASLHLSSNYFVADAKVSPHNLSLKGRFLKSYEDIALAHLGDVTLHSDYHTYHLRTRLFAADFTSDLQGQVHFKNATITIKNEKPRYLVTFTTPSLQHFLQELAQLYPLPRLRNIDAKTTLHLLYDTQTKSYKLSLDAKGFKGKKLNLLEYCTANLHGDMHRLIIDYYAVVYNHHGLYATKPSKIFFDDSHITIDPLWIEDKIQITGSYDTARKSGIFHAHTRRYTYSSIEGKLTLSGNLHATITDGRSDIEGHVRLHSGLITYKPQKTRIVKDKDIIIVDEIQTQSNYFYDNVALDIHIDAEKPILYKIPGLYALLRPDILVYKEYQKPLQLLGIVTILRGKYDITGGYLDILPSQLSFYGPPTDPMLELHLRTKKDRYTIFIDIGGNVENPIMHFSSEPYLKPNDILALLAFGSGSSSLGQALGGARLTSMLSNLFIKDVLANFGIKLDTLSILTTTHGIGFEVGTHITDKISVVYKNDEISTVIIRYQINGHIETEAIFGPNRSGVHIFYQKSK